MSAFQSPQMVTEPFPKVVDDYRKQGMHHAKDLIHGKDMHHGKDMLHGKDMNHPKDVAFRTRSSSGATVAVDEATGDVDDKKLGDTTHQVISSLFIGPRSENMPYFKENIGTILSELEMARARYFPGDGAKDGKWITPEVQNSPAFKKSKDKLSKAVQKTANLLGRSSIPFWSPRYEAHMCTDMTMASLLGYFMTMLYNPNNVALEASPLSTVAEIEVGEQLCTLFGYNIDETDTDTPTGWGHVTCDGTVANLESMWVARNLKYYPLALHKAMDKDQPLEFIRPKLFVETCQGDWKLFSSLEPWDLLNLKPKDVLDIPDRLYQEFGISNTFLSKVMNQFTVQSTGKDSLERLYTLDKPAQYLLANTRHYSWPKSAAIAGIGSDNVVGVPVDNAARIDIGKLEEMLNKKLEEQQPVYAVVAIMGSTEEGAVDPLSSVLALRKQFQAKGMSFLVHGDAAWGGYFCSMLPKDYHPGDIINLPTEMGDADGFVPDASLRAETQEDLFALRFADSITVDPHKAGYIPYPAGGLCYRDARMRFLVTWTSPYLSRGSVTSIGIYGVEGSKPGAAAVSTWLSNKTVGLNQEGYGSLLAEVTWTCTRFSAEWAVLSDANSPFVCVPFNELPSERDPNRSERKVENEKRRIRKEIINKPNSQIIAEDRNRKPEAKATKLMRALGSDLNINAFALNFRNRHDNKLNDDVEEANYLMKLVIEELSVDSPDDDPTKIPLYLTSTEFSDELYGDCKKHFMKRLGLEEDNTQDLMVLRNVVMSPFPSDGLFIHTLVSGVFKKVVEDATKIVQDRNELGEDFHNFLIQGSDDIHLVHLPLFHEANHRQQLIVKADFENVKSKSKDKYLALKRSSPNEPMILVTQRKTMLKEIVESKGTFTGQIMTKESGIILRNIPVTITNTVVSRPLNSKWRLPNYPEKNMPFYLYGNKEGINIDHVIARAPNTQLSASGCQIDFELNWDKPYVALLTDVREDAMQPFPPNNEIGSRHGAILGPKQKHAGDSNSSGGDGAAPFVITSETRDGKSRRSRFFFRPGAKFRVVVHEDGDRGNENVKYATSELGPLVAEGTLTVGDTVFVDSEAMNQDRYKKESKVNQWRHEFDQIGKDLD